MSWEDTSIEYSSFRGGKFPPPEEHMNDSFLIAEDIPPTDAIRKRLAVTVTEAALLRQLLRLAVRREREARRLAAICGGPASGDHAV